MMYSNTWIKKKYIKFTIVYKILFPFKKKVVLEVQKQTMTLIKK